MTTTARFCSLTETVTDGENGEVGDERDWARGDELETTGWAGWIDNEDGVLSKAEGG